MKDIRVKQIISYGIKYGLLLNGEDNDDICVIDIRPYFPRNPYYDRALRYLRGTDREVQKDIQKTSDFDFHLQKLIEKVKNLSCEILFLGCTAGHHRSVYIAILIGEALGVPVYHRDIDKK